MSNSYRFLYHAGLTLLMLLGGMIFYGIYNDLIIIRLPSAKNALDYQQSTAQRTSVKLHYWHNNQWNAEDKQILLSTAKDKAIQDLLTAWLGILEEEKILHKKTIVETVMLDKDGTHAFISFNRNPLAKEWSTFEKMMFIDGLLKTIKNQGIPLKTVTFLVHHKPLQDAHLDFNHPWPLNGYMG